MGITQSTFICLYAATVGITAIIFIPCDLGLDKLGADELDGVAQLLKRPGPILSARTRRHPNQARRQLRDRLPHLAAGHTLLDSNFAVHGYAMQLADPFG
jgi:hypothetical protein